MARRILTFFVLVVLTFGLAAYLVLGQVLDDIKSEHQRRQQQLHRLLVEELSNSYLLFDALIEQRAKLYHRLHRQALNVLGPNPADMDLAQLQKELASEAGFPIDVYLINEQMVIQQTTFAPDAGLDFKEPVFVDVRRFLQLAKEQERTLISQPTLELTSRQYKLYSYSPLPGGGFLELGYVDPELNRYFRSFTGSAALHPDAEVSLFLDNWGQLLVRLEDNPAADAKHEAVAIEQQRLAADYALFKKAMSNQSGIEKVEVAAEGGYKESHFYTRLLNLKLDNGLSMNLLAKITLDNAPVARVQEYFIRFFWALSLLVLVFMTALICLVRFRLVMPLQSIVTAIRNRKPAESHRWKRMPELHFLAESYNQALYRSQEKVEKLSQLSVTDPLTGLLNRRYLDQVFANELARSARGGDVLGFAMIDVDDFKAYNDLYGHRGGDDVLKQVAEILEHQFRRAGDFVFRIGGEEFAVLVTDPGSSLLSEQFQTLRERVVAAAIAHHGSRVADVLTVSIGLRIVFPHELITPEEVMESADQALYRAKGEGRNRLCVVSPSG